MFFVTYLSNANRAKLAAIDEKISNCRDMDERVALFAERAEVEEKRKDIKDCTFDECNELKSQLYGKLEQLMRLGKRSQAIQFQSMINVVGQRMGTIMMEQAKKEAEKEALRKEGKEVPEDEYEQSHPRPKSRSSSSKWTIDLDEID